MKQTQLELKATAAQIAAKIDQYCLGKFQDDHRTHLGASIIGSDCRRYVWSVFRWLKREVFSARMLRLFERGKREEAHLIEYIQAAGVTEFKPFSLSTEEQSRFSGVDGHYGGSTDGLGMFNGVPIVCEFKTHNAKSFANLKKNGVIVSKPKHFAQMCAYGKAFNIDHGLYVASNKNDDDLHIELLKLDFAYADDLTAKAFDIIYATVPPAKIALQSTAFECAYCVFQDICHRGAMPEKNCRSCLMSTATPGGQWFCRTWNATIPPEAIQVGCDQWNPITSGAQ